MNSKASAIDRSPAIAIFQFTCFSSLFVLSFEAIGTISVRAASLPLAGDRSEQLVIAQANLRTFDSQQLDQSFQQSELQLSSQTSPQSSEIPLQLAESVSSNSARPSQLSSALSVSEQPISEQPVNEQPVTHQTVPDQTTTDQTIADQPVTNPFLLSTVEDAENQVNLVVPTVSDPDDEINADSGSVTGSGNVTQLTVASTVTPSSLTLERLSTSERLSDVESVSVAQNLITDPEASTATPPQSSAVLGSPSISLQGAYLLQGDQSSARLRATGIYPVSPTLLFGATVDLTTGDAFTDSRSTGLNLNELYIATSLADYPNLRFVAGLMDLTSYFDRNSFAKDAVTHFFNPVFQTNPALSAVSIASRPGALVSWNVTDDLEIKAATFSSDRSLDNFALDGFAGEVGARFGNAIIRGTYVTARDAGEQDGFREIFQFARNGSESFGPSSDDREEAYGLNAEVFIPELKLGLFGRYGWYENLELDQGGTTYSFGLNFLDLLMPDDRLGLAYGRQLSNDDLRRRSGSEVPDVVELFYDFRISPNLRAGLTAQGRNGFSETIFGFRVRADFDGTALGRLFR